jgi:RNA polymerase sigma factor (sigma-70 family)
MKDVTQILNAIQQGDPRAAEQLLPLVYDELRQLAEQKMNLEDPGHTLQPTALVHEAYLRLVKNGTASPIEKQSWESRNHFFAAAAEAMRRILVDTARRKKRVKHGGGRRRVDLNHAGASGGVTERGGIKGGPVQPPADEIVALEEEIVALDRALTRLAAEDAVAAQVVQLHFFAGLPLEQVAEMTGVSRATAYRQWAYARAWLRCAIGKGKDDEPAS